MSSMMIVTLVAGIGLVVAGLLAIGYGVQYKEFSVGNTLILSGVIGVCAGMIMIGLWMAVRELKTIAQRLGAGLPHPPEKPRAGRSCRCPPARAAPADSGFLARDQVAIGAPVAKRPRFRLAPPPWHEEAACAITRAGARCRPGRRRRRQAKRNLLFSSTSRKERERAQTRTSEPCRPIC